MLLFSGTMVHNFTLDNSKHFLNTWHDRKNKRCTTVLKSETLNLFQNNCVNSLSLLFLLRTPVHIQCPSLWKCMILTSPSLFLLTFPSLFFPICFELLITQTFFDFPTRFELSGSTVCYNFNKSTNQSSWTDSGKTKLSVWHFCCWGTDVSLAKRSSGEIEAWGKVCIRRLPPTLPFRSLYENITFLLTIILST